MDRHQHKASRGVFGRLGQAAARLAAMLPENTAADALKGAVQTCVAEQWERRASQRVKLSRRLRWGSAKLAEQPIPRVARQGLEHLDAWLDRLAPEPAHSGQEARVAAAASAAAASHREVASETLVSPLDDSSLSNRPSDDNCIAAGTTPGKAADDPRPSPRRSAGRARRGGRRGGTAKS